MDGGAIWAFSGQTRITDSTLTGNEARSGGAIALAASVTITARLGHIIARSWLIRMARQKGIIAL